MDEISPFFVLDAEEKIQAGLLDEAISLCEKGLEEFPEYDSGWIALIKALIGKKEFDSAKEKTELAIKIFPNIATFQSLYDEIKAQIEQAEFDKSDTKDNQVDDSIEDNIISADEEIETEVKEESSLSDEASNITDGEIDEKLNEDDKILESESDDTQNRVTEDVPEIAIDENDKGQSEIGEQIGEPLPDTDNEEIIETQDEQELENNEDIIEMDSSDIQDIEAEDVIEIELDENDEGQGEIAEQIEEGQKETDNQVETEVEELEALDINEDKSVEDIENDEDLAENSVSINDENDDEVVSLPKGFLKQFYNPDSIDFDDNGELSQEFYDIIPDLSDKSLLERKSFRDINIADNISDIELPDISKDFAQINSEVGLEELTETIDDEFSQLAKKLEGAKIPKPDEVVDEATPKIDKSKEQGKTIVSETMANIYAQQGAYKEAEKAYKELLENNPDRKQYFLDKLNNLYKKMG